MIRDMISASREACLSIATKVDPGVARLTLWLRKSRAAATAKQRRRAGSLAAESSPMDRPTRVPRGGAPLLAAGGLPGDVDDVGAVDADVLKFAVRIGRQFVQNFPVTATLFQVTGNEGELHIRSPYRSVSSNQPR